MSAIVFMLRGCPAGWLGAYGNEWIGTPHLDRLAAESIVFDRHISDCPESTAASRTLLAMTRDERSQLGEALRSNGVRTVLVRANHPDTDAPEWFYAGWEEVFDARPQAEDDSPLGALLRSLPVLLERLRNFDRFLLWIEIDRLIPPWDIRQDVFEAYLGNDKEDEDELENAAQSTVKDDEEAVDEEDSAVEEIEEAMTDIDEANTEIDEPIEPVVPWYDPPTGLLDTADPDARTWLQSSFAAVVTSLDAELGSVFEDLRNRGLDQSAAWLVTSDFGYPLGEHGQIGLHRPWLYEELVHIPLILRLPGGAEACRRVSGFTQPPDVPPTLLQLLGVQCPEGMNGTSLMALAHGEQEASREHAITHFDLGGAAESAIRTDEWAYLRPNQVPDDEKRSPQLFEKPDDYYEVNDLWPRNIERADELEQRLKEQN